MDGALWQHENHCTRKWNSQVKVIAHPKVQTSGGREDDKGLKDESPRHK